MVMMVLLLASCGGGDIDVGRSVGCLAFVKNN